MIPEKDDENLTSNSEIFREVAETMKQLKPAEKAEMRKNALKYFGISEEDHSITKSQFLAELEQAIEKLTPSELAKIRQGLRKQLHLLERPEPFLDNQEGQESTEHTEITIRATDPRFRTPLEEIIAGLEFMQLAEPLKSSVIQIIGKATKQSACVNIVFRREGNLFHVEIPGVIRWTWEGDHFKQLTL